MEKKTELRGLGRGLTALLADVGAVGEGDMAAPSFRQTTEIAVENLIPNPNQPRRDFAAAALEELSKSIRKKGVIQPLIVRPMAEAGKYEIVAGERRWRAAQLAQLHKVPVLIRDLTDSEMMEVAIIENIQRADLNAIEEALAYRQLMDRFGHTQELIAEALSRSRSHIANQLRLLSLPDDVQALIRIGTLSSGHARALITCPNASELAQIVVARGLSVRETEKLAKSTATGKPKPKSRPFDEKDADTKAIEADLSANLKMLVRIEHPAGGDSGHLIVRYKNLDDLDLLCRVLSAIPRDVVI